jgi:hypothetical protein
MANWKQCTRRDKSRIYLNLDAAIAIRRFDEGFSRVYFAAGAEDDKLYFDVAESAETLIAPLEHRDWSGTQRGFNLLAQETT